jgi:hypothetical protein
LIIKKPETLRLFILDWLLAKKTASKLAVKTKDKDNPGMKNKNLVESVQPVSPGCVLESSVTDEKN